MALVFFLKAGPEGDKEGQNNGLVYDSEYINSGATIEDLVNKDSDSDGVFDWEESLLGTDPKKTDTNEDGISDGEEIDNLRKQAARNEGEESLLSSTANLTETDKFSREFFSTVATLNQTGVMDAAAVADLGAALATHIQNSTQRKVYFLSDLKIAKDDTVKTVRNYTLALNTIQGKYQANRTDIEILQEFMADENNTHVLSELDPIIEQLQKVVNELIKLGVPASLSKQHLDFTNALQGKAENLSDIKLYETDVIVALSGISKYEQGVETLYSATKNLGDAINKKLNNE